MGRETCDIRLKSGISFTTCFRQTTCYDCDNEACLHHGDKGADCPKYKCDNPNGVQNCENCEFIDDFIKEMRSAEVTE